MNIALFGISCVLTGVILYVSTRLNITDRPNARSSHTAPTPRGGGLAVLVTFVVALVILEQRSEAYRSLFFSLGGTSLLVGGVGWLDDLRGGISSLLRSLIHSLGALWAVYWLSGLPQIHIGSTVLSLGWPGFVLAVLGVIWSINLHNFMDGLDGLLGAQIIMVAILGGVLAWQSSGNLVGVVCFALASCVGGFLLWNWGPARIFSGDVGSGFLGAVIAILMIASDRFNGPGITVWLLLSAVFVVDATATLVARMISGLNIFEAHRTHAYQRLVQAGLSHRLVVVFVVLIDIVLGGLATLGIRFPHLHVPILVAAYVALFGIWYWIWANIPRRSNP